MAIAVTIATIDVIGNTVHAGGKVGFHPVARSPTARVHGAGALHHGTRVTHRLHRAAQRRQLTTRTQIRELSRDAQRRWTELQIRTQESRSDLQRYWGRLLVEQTQEDLRQALDHRNLDHEFGKRARFIEGREVLKRTEHRRERQQTRPIS